MMVTLGMIFPADPALLAQAASQPSGITLFLPLVVLMGFFYLLMILSALRGQNHKQIEKSHEHHERKEQSDSAGLRCSLREQSRVRRENHAKRHHHLFRLFRRGGQSCRARQVMKAEFRKYCPARCRTQRPLVVAYPRRA